MRQLKTLEEAWTVVIALSIEDDPQDTPLGPVEEIDQQRPCRAADFRSRSL